MSKRILSLALLSLAFTTLFAQNVPDVYGVMRTSSTWGAQGNAYNPKHGFYRITTGDDGIGVFTRLTNESNIVVTDGALYADNKVYGVWSEVIKAFLGTYRSSWRTYDGETLAQTNAIASENKLLFATSLTYDYITATAYATAPTSYGSDGNPEIDYQLKRVDLATGECTVVGSMGARVKGIAAAPDGQLWGVGSSQSVTSLYKIDKQSGKATKVCALDINYFDGVDKTSLLCDMRNGTLYIVCETYSENANKERTFGYGVYEINTQTGKTQCVSKFQGEELMIGCYLKQSHPKAPAPVALAKDDVTSESVTVVTPGQTYDGTALTGTLNVEISVDGGEAIVVEDLAPGKTVTTAIATLASGTHRISVVARNEHGPSVPTTIEVFIGNDTPAAPTGVAVTDSDNGQTAHVIWTAPTEGENGGKIDHTKLTYRITRKPENKVLAEGLTACEYTDYLDRVMGVTQYQVEAVIDGKSSKSAYSAICTLGTPHPIPYLQMFASYSDWMSYTEIDNNHDSTDDTGGKWYYDADNQVAMYYTNQKSADDYLFTPTLQLDPKKIYRLQFQAWGYHDNGSVNHLQVHLAKTAAVDDTTATVMDEYFYNKTQAFAYGLFRPSEGDCRLAFHNISDVVKDGGYDHLFLDNILLQEYGSALIASEPTDVEATRMASGNMRVRFKAPATAVDGSALTKINRIEICQAGDTAHPLATISDVTPGEQCEVVIAPPYAGQITLAVCAVTDEGRGMEAYGIVDTRNDIPMAVTDINVSGKNAYTIAEITWKQSAIGVNGNLINLDDITYTIYRYIGVYRQLIAEGVKGTSFTDRTLTEALGDRQQEYIIYCVVPQTDGGQGSEARSTATLLGRSYDLPYAESFSNQQAQTYTWKMDNVKTQGGSWGLASTGYDPYTQAQDGDNGLLSFSTSRTFPQGEADYLSPRIDVSNHNSPVASFYVYRGTKYTSAATLQAGIYTPETGAVMLTEAIATYSATDGWERVEMEIPSPYAESDHLQLCFRAETSHYTASIHIDNISIVGQRAEYEVKAERIVGSNECVIGQDNEYTVLVRNVGSKGVNDITVTLAAGEEVIGTQTLTELASSDLKPVVYHFTPALGATLGTLTLTATVYCAQDGSEANNTVTTTVDLIAPMLPLVNDLQATANPEHTAVKLSWSDNTRYPRQEYVTEDCESITPFTIQNMNGWTTIDMDGAKTIQTSLDGVSLLEWEHSGDPQAWIAFNLHRAGMDGFVTARSGSQFFVSFESTAGGGNDDWLISPQLSGEEQTLSFYAKCFYPYLVDEALEVWISRSVADDISKFEKISGKNPVTISTYDKWTACQFTLPEGTRYAAIRCVSKAQYGLIIDDITYSPMHTPLEFWGYNVYRDGELITEEPLAEPEFTDTTYDFKSPAKYNVTVLYDLGESVFSNTVSIDPADGIATVQDTSKDIVKFIHNGQIYIRAANGTIYRTDGTRK